MKTHLPLLILSALPLCAEPVVLKVTAAFSGTSTLHDFEGSATAKPAKADWQEKGQVLNAPEIVFEVKQLTTDHKKRDRKMMNMFEPALYPKITGQITNWNLGKKPGKKADAPVLEISMHGQTVKVPVKIEKVVQKDEGLVLHCSFTLSLKKFGLKRPSAALGMIKVGDEVKVSVTCRILQDAGEEK